LPWPFTLGHELGGGRDGDEDGEVDHRALAGAGDLALIRDCPLLTARYARRSFSSRRLRSCPSATA
jgi:hypothetical protein